MDESGFPPSDQGTTRVIGRRGTRVQHKQGAADHENVTTIVTICADGSGSVSYRPNSYSDPALSHRLNQLFSSTDSQSPQKMDLEMG